MRKHFWHWPGLRQLGYAIGLGLVQAAWFACVYGGANWFTAQHDYRVRVHFAGELLIPLMPAAAVLYLSLFPFTWMAPFVLRSRRELEALTLSLAVATGVAGICFLIVPAATAFPSPSAQQLGPWEAWYKLARNLALENNFVPSLHVAFTIVCAMVFSTRAANAIRWLLWIWAGGIVLSTVLTHQHYLLDVVTGWLLGAAAYKLVYRRLVITSACADKTRRASPATSRAQAV